MSNSPSRLAIIAGRGDVPRHIIDDYRARGLNPYVVCLEQSVHRMFSDISDCDYFPITAIGKILDAIHRRHIKDIAIIGYLERPNMTALSGLDMKGMKLLRQLLSLSKKGDNTILTRIIAFLEQEGLVVHAAHLLVPDLLMPADVMTKKMLTKDEQRDAAFAKDALTHMGCLDIGQSLIIQKGRILGIEGAEGTDGLIQRCAVLQEGGEGALLVKMLKPQQEIRLDFPCIGLRTLEHLVAAKMRGVVAPKGQVMLIDKEHMIAYANQHQLVITGLV